MQKYLQKLAQYVYHHALLVCLISGLATVLSTYSVYRLASHLDTDLSALLPDNYPSVLAMEQIKARVAGLDYLTVLIECENWEATRSFADHLVQELGTNQYKAYIHFIDYQRDIDFFKKHAPLYMALPDLNDIRDCIEDRIAEEKLKLSPMYIKLDDEAEEGFDFSDIEQKYKRPGQEEAYYTSPEHTLLAIRFNAAGAATNLSFARQFFTTIENVVHQIGPQNYDSNMHISYGGTIKNRLDEYDVIRHDITSTLLYGTLGVVLILVFYFKQPLAAIFIGGPLLMGLAWAFAITYMVIGRLNTITGFLFVILFGMGIDFGVHFFARYLESRTKGQSIVQAFETMLTQTGSALFTSGLTTSAAFYALMITDFRGFSEFGFIVDTGILTSMLAMITVLLAALTLSDRDLKWIGNRPLWGHTKNHLKNHFPAASGILIIGVLLILYLGYKSPQLTFEYDFTNLRSNLPASVEVKRKLDTLSNYSSLSQSPAVILADNQKDLEEVVSAVETRFSAQDATPTAQSTRTLWSSLPDSQNEKLEIIASIKLLANGEGAKLLKGKQKTRVDSLRELLDVKKLAITDIPSSIQKRFASIDGTPALFAFIYPSVQLRDGRNTIAIAKDIGTIQTPSGKIYHASNSNIIFADMLTVMLKDSRTAMIATISAVLLIILIDFRNSWQTLLVMLPLMVGLIWTCGSMVVMGTKLNFYNIVVFPCIIGMGVDNVCPLGALRF